MAEIIWRGRKGWEDAYIGKIQVGRVVYDEPTKQWWPYFIDFETRNFANGKDVKTEETAKRIVIKAVKSSLSQNGLQTRKD